MTFSERIAAVHLMQRFVRMSRVLIPTCSSLLNKKNLTLTERQKLERIKAVYENFHADPKASMELINSNILYLIQRVYQVLVSQEGESPESFYLYNQFIKESDRLISDWDKQLLN